MPGGSQHNLNKTGQQPPAIRHAYETHGVESFYRTQGGQYRNPHEPQIRHCLEVVMREWKPDTSSVLDLAAGSGEVTIALHELGVKPVDAIDPFTHKAYEERTGRPAGRESFEQIATGAVAGRHYSLVVCSFALHLIEESRLPQVCYQLSTIADQLLVLTPHKRPQIRGEWGWELTNEMVVQRVRARLYRSIAQSSL